MLWDPKFNFAERRKNVPKRQMQTTQAAEPKKQAKEAAGPHK